MRYFPASVIARVAKRSARTIKRRAAREGWPRRQRGNVLEFQPPRGLIAKCLAATSRADLTGLRNLSFAPARRAEIFRSENRFAALCGLEMALLSGEPVERALVRVARDFTFHVSPSALRLWHRQFAKEGFSGLLENKRGHSGRKAPR
jgi:hypothetical protein